MYEWREMVLTLAEGGGVGTSDVKWCLPGLMVKG